MDRLKIALENEILTAALLGEVDHHSAVSVRSEIDAAMYKNLPETLVLDLSSVDFMDSSGLGLILGRYTKSKDLGIAFVIRNPSIRIEKMLRMAGIDKMMKIEKAQAV